MAKIINRNIAGIALSAVLWMSAALTTHAQSVSQSIPGPVCVGQSTQFVYSGGCPSQNISWFLEGNTDATLTPAGANLVNVTWNSAGGSTVVAYCGSNPSLTGATSGLVVNASGGTSSVSISGPSSICGGATVTYTASPTNGGTSPSYQWKVNGQSRQNGPSASFQPNDLALNDQVTVSMLSNKPCISNPTSNSNTITITNVTQPTAVSVTINDPGQMCPGEEEGLTFTAVPTNGGSGPEYQWYRNGSPAQDNQEDEHGPVYRPYYDLQDGDNVRVEMTSNLGGCLSGNPALSNLVSIDLKTPTTPSVSINYSPSVACEGQQITFTATSPQEITSYDWKINSSSTLSTAEEFIPDLLHPGDVVYLSVGVTGECLSGTTAQTNTSQILTIQPAHAATIDPDGNVKIKSTEVQQINASTGTAYAYQWTKDGNIISGATTSTYTATEDGAYTAIISAPTGCSISSDVLYLTLNKLPVVTIDGAPSITFHIPPNTKTIHGSAYDPDGVITAYLWTKESGPTVTLENTTTPDLVLKNPEVGTYVFKLTATDDFPESASETVTVIVQQLDNNYNWIKETLVQQEGAGTITDVNELVIADGEKSVNWTYFDGLGRPMQNVSVQGSPDKFDVVTPVVYDEYGREKTKFLPYVPGQSNGWYKSDAVGDGDPQGSYSSSPHAQFYDIGGQLAKNASPFAETVFEPSPLNRVIKQGAPGVAWQPDPEDDSYDSDDATVKMAYAANEADEVLLWSYTAPTPTLPQGLVDAHDGTDPVYYDENQLSKNKTRDEQQHEVIEFTDKLGRTVLKKVQAPDSKWAQTYYIYDDFGSLVTVLPPQATALLNDEYLEEQSSDQDAFLARWAFRYTYDGRKRMTQKQVPGAKPVFMVYDDRDRLVLTQDGNQRLSDQWTFTKYDALNRPILTGLYTHGSSLDQEGMQTFVDAFYDNNPFFEERGSAVHGYSNQSFPTTVTDEDDYLTVTYYDDYEFDTPEGFDFGYIETELQGQESEEFARVKGLVTGTKVKNLDDDSWYLAVNYYDDRYRVIQTVSQNHKGGLDHVTSVYDFPGKVLATKTTHSVTGAAATFITRSFEYDHAGRLIETKHKVGDGAEVVLAENDYNELGQLIKKNLHSEDEGTNFAQQVDYRYNIRGWLTRINNSELEQTGDGGPDDYFGMELAYETPFSGVTADAQFNGNISAMKWSTNLGLGQEVVNFPEYSRPKALAYGFTYDEMNRLNAAAMHALTGSSWDASTAFHEDGITYDLNGNILGLHRTTSEGDEMDLLDYDYGEGTGNHSNKLLSVTDAADDEKGFIDGNTTGADYDYDDNGNMTLDKNKGITSIEYNHLNLPSKVTKGTEGYIKYIYDATGRKLRQEVYDDNEQLQKKTDYLGEFIYEDNALAFINHEEGRIIPDGNEYQYHLKDHLGNVRLTFTTKEDTEAALATLETAYADEERAQFLYYDEAVKVNSFLFDHTHRVAGSGENIPVQSVSLTTSAITLRVGQTATLQATVQPSNAADKTVSWSSSDTDVATINTSGEITAIAQGNSTITVTTTDGGFTASLLLTVEASDNLVINAEFDQGLTGWNLYDYTPEKDITVSVVQDGGLSGTNSARVNITNDNNVGWRIQFAQHLGFHFEVGRTYQISFVAKAESARTIVASITGETSGATYWQPSAFNLTTSPQTFGPLQYVCNNSNVDNEASFRFNFFMAYGVISDVWIDKVVIKDITQGGNVTAVEVTPEALTLAAGQTRLLEAAVVPSNAANQTLTWTSSDVSVATVTAGGLVTAGLPGTATITATSQDGGHTATSVVTVKPEGINLVSNHEFDDGLSGWTFRDWTSAGGNTAVVVQGAGLSGDNSVYVDIVSDDNSGWTINLNQALDGAIEVGRTYEISFMAKAGTVRDIGVSISGNSNSAWWQQNVTLGTTPTLYGPFTYQCTNVGSDTRFTAMFTLAKGVISDVWIDKLIINDVTDGPGVVSGISIPPKLTLTNGQSKALIATIMPSNAANQNITWISNNTAVATVDEGGVVTAHSPGAAVIRVATEDSGFTAQCILEVLPGGTAGTQNAEFDDGLNGWVFYDWTGPGNSNGGNVLSVVQGAGLSGNNAAHIDVVNDDNASWTLQLRQGLDFPLEVGRTYEVSFMARAESNRTIVPVVQGGSTEYWKVTTNLTTAAQTFIYKFTVDNTNVENEESFAFKFYLARGVVSDIWIDNVVVRDLSGGGSNPLVGDRIEAENFDSQSGLYVSEGALNGCELNDWASYEDILLTGVKELRVHLASGGSVGNMEVRLGSLPCF